jgi:uncharacterized Ntn-hydrolase superfamily protein
MTYSIVAGDADTGMLGVAVQSCMFGANRMVPYVRAGVGAMAIQAYGDRTYGPRCLDAIEAGVSAPEALASATALDATSAVRQIGLVGADGSAAAFTGEACAQPAGHLVGDGFTVQANMMASDRVWPAMAEAFAGAAGSFPRRMLAALQAAESAGGDARGSMSAGIFVAARDSDTATLPAVDLRVDRSDDPIRDLAALVDAHEAYDRFGRGVASLSGADIDTALAELAEALKLLPREPNFRFWQVRALLRAGDIERARTELRDLVAEHAGWEAVYRALVGNGSITLPSGVSPGHLVR